ncbi:hypothetical protein [uncultured Sunxiuqinia sp.]|uniref:hypothetical protein n=1 Tax=uncultured Sunxiuqinia sp. TaxID=1573825 RepID=UPI002AA6226F|nr:hypothetical protein [uncultured Sunxiuqinia sp.]
MSWKKDSKKINVIGFALQIDERIDLVVYCCYLSLGVGWIHGKNSQPSESVEKITIQYLVFEKGKLIEKATRWGDV